MLYYKDFLSGTSVVTHGIFKRLLLLGVAEQAIEFTNVFGDYMLCLYLTRYALQAAAGVGVVLL